MKTIKMWMYCLILLTFPFFDLEIASASLYSNFIEIPSQFSPVSQGEGYTIYLPLSLKHYEKLETMEMVSIPAGEFWMGCDPEHNGGLSCYSSSELPLHLVYLDSFAIDKTEVTNGQYWQCVLAGFCSTLSSSASFTRSFYFDNPEFVNYPVVNISWTSAQNYCNWLGKRLPTEAEWEKAARGAAPRGYPWGDGAPSCSLGNYIHFNGFIALPCVGDTSRVGGYPDGASPYGVLDMMGNAWEWVSDWYSFDYYENSPYQNPAGPENGEYKILRGGSFGNEDYFVRTPYRGVYGQVYFSDESTGFRCASTTAQ